MHCCVLVYSLHKEGEKGKLVKIDQSNSVNCKQCTVVYSCTRCTKRGKEKICGNRSIKQGKKCTVVDRQHFDTDPDPDPDPTLYPGQVNTSQKEVSVIGLNKTGSTGSGCRSIRSLIRNTEKNAKKSINRTN
jgi:hypothetical protein